MEPDDETLMLEAINAGEPWEVMPEVGDLPLDRRHRLVGSLYKQGYVTAHVFQGERVGAGQLLALTESGHQVLQERLDAQDQDSADDPGLSIEGKRLRRDDYLKVLYRRTDGNPARVIDSSDLGADIGLSAAETMPVARALRSQDLIVYRATGPLVALTSHGVNRAEELIAAEQAPQPEPVKPTDGAPDDREFMELAIEAARHCVSEADKVSPKVGAVVVRDGEVIGTAFRGELDEGEHAEFTLLERKLPDERLAGATLYTTLEPCTSRNRPKLPCADRIIERRIRRVVIGVLDPNDRIRGRGELRLREAGVEVTRFSPDLMAQIEELNREFAREHAGAQQVERTKSQTADPADPTEVGPNGHSVGYNDDGDKVEFIPDPDHPDEFIPMVLRRNDELILAEYNFLWEKVWWNRHQALKQQVDEGDATLPSGKGEGLEVGEQAAAELEERYGRDALELDEMGLELATGRLSALAWVLGAEWDESLDT